MEGMGATAASKRNTAILHGGYGGAVPARGVRNYRDRQKSFDKTYTLYSGRWDIKLYDTS